MYYALWYYTNCEEKSTNAISINKNILYQLQIKTLTDRNCLYHNYKHLIKKIIIEPIKCYFYDNKNKSLIEIANDDFNNLILTNNGLFYASYNSVLVNNLVFDKNFILEEILIYLSKEDHETWLKIHHEKNDIKSIDIYPSFFYTETISNNSICLDYYYEEGIMNA